MSKDKKHDAKDASEQTKAEADANAKKITDAKENKAKTPEEQAEANRIRSL